MTAEEVMRCAACGGAIDELTMGMLFWHVPDERDDDDALVASDLRIGHKQCCGKDRHYNRHQELAWYADHEEALDRLATTAAGYKWTAEQLQKLILVAWAVPLVATDDNNEFAKRAAQFV
jgi:hypothetical protein